LEQYGHSHPEDFDETTATGQVAEVAALNAGLGWPGWFVFIALQGND
jgi:hypothetical protein